MEAKMFVVCVYYARDFSRFFAVAAGCYMKCNTVCMKRYEANTEIRWPNNYNKNM